MISSLFFGQNDFSEAQIEKTYKKNVFFRCLRRAGLPQRDDDLLSTMTGRGAREERARLLAAARANGSDDESLVMQELLTSLAADASKAFSAEALSLAKSHPSLVAEIERAFDLLIASGDRNKTAAAHQRVSLRPMPRQHRRLVHELSHIYHIGTIAQGTEPQRYINLLRTDLTAWPDCTLSEAAE